MRAAGLLALCSILAGCGGKPVAACRIPPFAASSPDLTAGMDPMLRRQELLRNADDNAAACLRTAAFTLATSEASPTDIATGAMGRCRSAIESYETLSVYRYFDGAEFSPSFTETVAIERVSRDRMQAVAVAAALDAKSAGC